MMDAGTEAEFGLSLVRRRTAVRPAYRSLRSNEASWPAITLAEDALSVVLRS